VGFLGALIFILYEKWVGDVGGGFGFV